MGSHLNTTIWVLIAFMDGQLSILAVGQFLLEFTLAKSSLGVNSKQLVKSIIMSLGEHHRNTSDNQNAYDIPFSR